METALIELGIDYSVSGKEAIAKCPNPSHNDRHPSWSMNLKTGVHHCFSCGFSGSLAHLVSVVLHLSYPEAVSWCNSKIGWARAHQWREDVDNTNFSPAYLKLTDADLALFTLPPEDKLKEKQISQESCEALGIKWNPEEHTWICPVREPFTNSLWGWQSKNDRDFKHYPRGIRKSETLFGLDAFPNGSPVVLVESPIDCARLFTAGIRGGLSSYGVQVSNHQFSLIHSVSEHLVIALDNDMPGVDQTARICTEFDQVRRISVFNYGLSQAKDPGEMTDEEIEFGIQFAWPKLRWLNVYRNFGRLPERARKSFSRPWQSFSSIYDGTWQDSHSNISGGGITATR